MDTNENSAPSKPSLDLTDTLNVLHSMVDRGAQATLLPVKDAAKLLSESTHTGELKEEHDLRQPLPPIFNVQGTTWKPKEVPPSIHIHLSPELLKTVKDYDNNVDDVDAWRVLNHELPPPLPPEVPKNSTPEQNGGSEHSNIAWLHPPTPTVTVESKREAYSEKLMEYVLLKNQPVTVIKGLTTALKIGQ